MRRALSIAVLCPSMAALLAAGVGACTPDPGRPATGGDSAPAPSPTVVDHDVRWPTATPDRATFDALDEAARRSVENSKVPVLLVARSTLLPATKVIARDRFTAVSTEGDGIHVSLSATRSAHRHPHLPKVKGTHEVRGEPAFITQNEAIWSASWMENGVAYVLELECASLPDPRCEDDAHLRSLIAELAYVGGEGAP